MGPLLWDEELQVRALIRGSPIYQASSAVPIERSYPTQPRAGRAYRDSTPAGSFTNENSTVFHRRQLAPHSPIAQGSPATRQRRAERHCSRAFSLSIHTLRSVCKLINDKGFDSPSRVGTIASSAAREHIWREATRYGRFPLTKPNTWGRFKVTGCVLPVAQLNRPPVFAGSAAAARLLVRRQDAGGLWVSQNRLNEVPCGAQMPRQVIEARDTGAGLGSFSKSLEQLRWLARSPVGIWEL